MSSLRWLAKFALAVVCLWMGTVTRAAAQSCAVDTSTSPNIKICSPQPNERVPSQFTVAVSAFSASSPITTVVVGPNVYHPNTNQFQVDIPFDMFPRYEYYGLRASMVNANNAGAETFNPVWIRKTAGTCVFPTTSRTMNWCEPGMATAVTSPLKMVANSFSDYFVSHVKVYVDGVERYNADDDEVYTYIDLSAGGHTVAVQFWDSQGFLIREERSVSVVERSAGCSAPGTAGVNLCLPQEGETMKAPLRLSARTSAGSVPITYMRLYRNAQPIWEGPFNTVDTDVHLTMLGPDMEGAATFGVVAWNAQGASFVDTARATISGQMPAPMCAIPNDRTVTMCFPGNGDVVSATTVVSARGRWDGKTLSAMRIYVDDQNVFTQGFDPQQNWIYQKITLSPGQHRIVVVAWTNTGEAMVSQASVVTVQ